MAPHVTSFVCSGCREQIRVCEPETGAVVISCPIANCRREVWALPVDGWQERAPVSIGCRAAPDLSRRFSVDQCRLLLNGRELISGPADLLEGFAADLNTDNPPEEELPARIRGMIQACPRGCHFQPGGELVRLGIATRHAERRA